jgi:hypothetical protein
MTDPVFQAIAALEQLKIHAKEVDAAHSVAERAFFAARKEQGAGVKLDGEERRTHEQIDVHFTLRDIEKLCARRHLSDAECAARQAAHDQLALKEEKNAEVERRVGYHEINEQNDSAYDAVSVAQDEVMEAKPVTPAGAISLLRFVTGLMEGLFPNDDEHEHYVGALRNAADFFERSASA